MAHPIAAGPDVVRQQWSQQHQAVPDGGGAAGEPDRRHGTEPGPRRVAGEAHGRHGDEEDGVDQRGGGRVGAEHPGRVHAGPVRGGALGQKGGRTDQPRARPPSAGRCAATGCGGDRPVARAALRRRRRARIRRAVGPPPGRPTPRRRAPTVISTRTSTPMRRPAEISPPPATAPSVQMPCIVAITGRPAARSTATACTLNATLSAPNSTPSTTARDRQQRDGGRHRRAGQRQRRGRGGHPQQAPTGPPIGQPSGDRHGRQGADRQGHQHTAEPPRDRGPAVRPWPAASPPTTRSAPRSARSSP